MTKTTLIDYFNTDDAYIVLAQGLCGGLWLLWNQKVEINVDSSSHNFILVVCI